MTHNISQPRQYNFDTNGVSIGIYNQCSNIMYHIKQEFLGDLRTGWCFIIEFKVTKLHMIYEGNIAWNVNDDTGHIHQVKTQLIICAQQV